MKKEPLILRMYRIVVAQPGKPADYYLKSMGENIRNGGVLTTLERCGYVRWQKDRDTDGNTTGVKKWFPVYIDGAVQNFNPKHPYILSQLQKQKDSKLPQMRYYVKLGEFLNKLALADYLTDDQKAELYEQVIQDGYIHALFWKSKGYRNISSAAQWTLDEITKATQKLEELAGEHFDEEV